MSNLDNFPTSEAGKRMLKRVAPVYENSYVAKWLYQVMGLEWDEARALVLSLRDQIFTETVTWGIEYQEHKYSITPDESLSLDERRARLKRRTQQKFPLNPGVMEQYLKNGWGITTDIDETVAEGYIQVTFPEELPESVEDMLKDLRRIKPSHLVLMLKLIRELRMDDDESKIRLAIASLFEGSRHVGLALPEDLRHRLNTSIIPARSGILRIGAGFPTASEPLPLDIGLGLLTGGKVGTGVNAEDLPEISREEAARLAPILGVAYEKRGLRVLPIAAPEQGIVPLGYGVNTHAAGRRQYGLAPPESSIIVPIIGTATAHNGGRKTGADLKDLPDWFKGGLSIISEVIRTIDARTGKNFIGLTEPEREIFSIAAGFLHGLFGVTAIAADGNDLPPDFAERTAKISAAFGMSLKQKARRRISLALPEPSQAAFGAGLLQKWSGTRLVPLSPPEEAVAEQGVGIATAGNGEHRLLADSADIPDRYKHITDDAQAAFSLGMAQTIKGIRKTSLPRPEDATGALFFGSTFEQSGVREIAVDDDDIPKVPQSVFENVKATAYLGIALDRRGKHTAGLEPVAEPPAMPLMFGMTAGVTGAAAIRADPADLPDEYKSPDAHAAIFAGVHLLQDTRRWIRLDAPEDGRAIFHIALAETHGGKRSILLAMPDDTAATLKTGFAGAYGGVRSVSVSQDDLPDIFGESSAWITPRIGFDTHRSGSRRTGLSCGAEEKSGIFAAAVGTITGYKVIGADLSDLEPPRPRMRMLPHAGLAHAGVMAAG